MKMRVRWLALGLLLGCASLAVGQSDVGFLMRASCGAIGNPVTAQTVCWQVSAPTGWFVWDGATFVSPTLGGPYAPTTFTAGGVLIGNGTGAITATTTPTLTTLTLTGQGALTLMPFGTSTHNTGIVAFRELAANGAEFLYLQAPDSIATSFGIILPAIPGTSGQCLGTDGGNPVTTSWVACSPGAGSGITTLNALTAVTQTFANDTNVTLTSVTSTHTLGWTGTLAVARGGIGVGTLAANGALYGNGTGAVLATAAGAADTVLRVPGGGGAPAFGAVDVSKVAAITGLVRTANLGSGTANSTTFLRGDQTWVTGVQAGMNYNFVFNSDFEVWGAGSAAAPTGWTFGGTTIARDTTPGEFKTGAASVSVTRTVGLVGVTQNLNVPYGPISFWQSQVVTCGAWVRATVASTTFIQIDDGIGISASSTHSGGGTFEFLTISRSISNVATGVSVTGGVFNTNTTSQFDSFICVLGTSIANWQPSGYQGRKAILTLNSGSTQVAANTTTYIGTGQASTTETTVETPIPFRCVARNLTGRVSIAPGGAQTDTFTLRKNEADTALTFSIAAAAQQGSDITREVDLAKGDRLATKIVTSATALATQAVTTLECEEVPAGI